MPDHLPVFLVGPLVVTVVPGADMALVTRQVVTRGRRAAQTTIFVWLTTYTSLVARMQAAITRPRINAALERVTGAVLIALGLRVAVAHR